MTVTVVNGMVDTGKGVFYPGQTIIGLSDKDEQNLVENGVCRYMDKGVDDQLQEEQRPEIDENGLVKLPGGFYQLPNGEKVRGKENALDALEELKGSNGEDPNNFGSSDEKGGSADDPQNQGGPNTDITGSDD